MLNRVFSTWTESVGAIALRQAKAYQYDEVAIVKIIIRMTHGRSDSHELVRESPQKVGPAFSRKTDF
jgi:hypothetical protein